MDEFFTFEDTMVVLDISRQALERLVAEGRLQPRDVGGELKFPRAPIIAMREEYVPKIVADPYSAPQPTVRAVLGETWRAASFEEDVPARPRVRKSRRARGSAARRRPRRSA